VPNERSQKLKFQSEIILIYCVRPLKRRPMALGNTLNGASNKTRKKEDSSMDPCPPLHFTRSEPVQPSAPTNGRPGFGVSLTETGFCLNITGQKPFNSLLTIRFFVWDPPCACKNLF